MDMQIVEGGKEGGDAVVDAAIEVAGVRQHLVRRWKEKGGHNSQVLAEDLDVGDWETT